MYDDTPADLFDFHQSMLVDEIRTTGYHRAIAEVVQPGDIVLDIGAGTGLLSLLALTAGAEHVYAIERGPIIEVARRIVRRNGVDDRVSFIRGWSTEVDLPVRADVLVTETIGNLGFDEGILSWSADARARLLTPQARMVPRSLRLVAAPVETPRDHRDVNRWYEPLLTYDFSPLSDLAASNMIWVDLSPAALFSDPVVLASVDLSSRGEDTIGGTATVTARRDAIVHGIGCWFEAVLAPGITIGNAPPTPVPSWSQAFFPVVEPMPVSVGSPVTLMVTTDKTGGHWQWQVVTENGEGPVRSTRAGNLEG